MRTVRAVGVVVAQPHRIALDGQFAYWINKGVNGGMGSVVRVGK